jgi:hypothetical protein
LVACTDTDHGLESVGSWGYEPRHELMKKTI